MKRDLFDLIFNAMSNLHAWAKEKDVANTRFKKLYEKVDFNTSE